MADLSPEELEELAVEADELRRARWRREAAMTPTERLERVDELCRQLADIRLVGDDQA